MRDRTHAGLFPLYDSVRRRSLHAREKSRYGVGAPDSHAISRRLALRCVLFHDSAEECHSPAGSRESGTVLHQHPRGTKACQRFSAASAKDMRQIVMITDGKPSCLTLEDGRIYKNAFGLDPLVISQTLEEVNRCKRPAS